MPGDGFNPFKYINPVGPEDLIDRRTELDEIMDMVASGNNCRLVGPRRFGKTSLLGAIQAEADRQGYVPVNVDLFGVANVTGLAEQIATAYTKSLNGPLKRWVIARLRTLGKVEVGAKLVSVSMSITPTHPLLSELLDLPLHLYERTGRRCVVMFDEFQTVFDLGKTDAAMRSVIQHHGDAASYIFAGSHVGMMNALFADRHRAFYAQAAPFVLTTLGPEDVGDYVSSRFEANMGKDPGAGFEPLLDMAAGHPQKSMMLAHHLWRATPPDGTATEETWFTAFDRAMVESVPEFRAYWEGYSPAERNVIVVVGASRRLYDKDSDLSRGSGTTTALRSLLDSGDIVEDASNPSRHRIVDPLYAHWIRAGRPSEWTGEDL